MARIMMAGNEMYDIFAEGWTVFNGVYSPSVNQPGGRKSLQGNGGRHYYYLNASIGLNQIAKLLPTLATGPATGGYSEVYGRFAHGGLNATTAKSVITLRNSNTGLIVGSIRMVDVGSPNFRYDVYNGAGTTLASGGFSMNFNAVNANRGGFQRVEFHFKCAASGGIWEVWVDDVLHISAAGLNTSNGTTVVFDQIIIGNSEVPSQTNYWDDIAINDLTGTTNNGRVGEGHIILLRPVREGTFSGLVNTFNTSKENYDHVNRPVTSYNDPNNNTLYVGTNVAGSKDVYKLESPAAEFGGFSALKPIANCVRNGIGITNAKLLLEPGVLPPATAATFTPAAGGSATAGAHEFVIVNKIGTGYSLPGPVSATFTANGNKTANLVVPVSADGRVTAREVYASKAGAPGVYYLVGTIPDNVTTAFVFNIADGSFGTLTQPVEMASANIPLPNGAFGYIENIFDKNPTTGLPWSHDEVETIEAGLQFNT